jgi:hypothetical protein
MAVDSHQWLKPRDGWSSWQDEWTKRLIDRRSRPENDHAIRMAIFECERPGLMITCHVRWHDQLDDLRAVPHTVFAIG